MSENDNLTQIPKTIDYALALVNKIIPNFLTDFDKMIHDELSFIRGKQRIKILERAHKYLENKNISPKGIKAKLLFNTLDFGSLEEDDYMIDKWASLIANASINDPNINVLMSFPNILNNLTSFEVKILDELYKMENSKESIKGFYFLENISISLNINTNTFNLLTDNLISLNLIESYDNNSDFWGISEIEEITKSNIKNKRFYLRFNSLGRAFVKAYTI